MTNQDTIITLFNGLSKDEQVETLVALYESMYDAQKDEFLEETENA